MSIQKTCMVLNLHISYWLGYQFDRETTNQVTENASAARDSARVNKHLIAKEALAPITSARCALHAHFYAKTLPWKDNGDRLIMRESFMPFIEDHQALAGKFNDAVEDFLTRGYPIAQDQAEFRMGTLFNAQDYPTAKALRHKFGISLDIDAIPTAYDFRLSDNEEVMQQRVTQAVHALWKKLAEPLERYVEKLSEPEAIFRDSLIGNLREVVALIPSLNFTDDPDLETIRSTIETELAVWSPNDLRKDKQVRAHVSDAAKNIIDTMHGFMTAMGGDNAAIE